MSKFKAEAPFPLAGKGAFFKFTVSDVIELEEKYGTSTYFEEIHIGLNAQSAKITKDCVTHGLKHRVDGKVTKLDFDLDQIDFALSEFFKPVMDALCLQAIGMDYVGYMEEIIRIEGERDKAMADIDKGNDPFPKSVESSESSASDGKPD